MIVSQLNLRGLKAQPKISPLELMFHRTVIDPGLVPPTTHWAGGADGQLQFHHGRRWLFDFAWPEQGIAVEIQGGTWARKGARKCRACGNTPGGGHSTGSGIKSDLEKYNSAMLQGWSVYAFTGEMIKGGQAAEIMSRAFS